MKPRTLILAAALALVGVACAEGTEPRVAPADVVAAATDPDPTPTTPPTPTSEPTATPEPIDEETIAIAAFRVTVGEDHPEVWAMTDEGIVDLAEATCEVARMVNSVEELAVIGLAIANEQGLDPDLIAQVTGAAISGWCPEAGERIGLS